MKEPLGNSTQGSNARYGSAVHVLPGHYQGRRRIYTGQKVGVPTTVNNVVGAGNTTTVNGMMMMNSTLHNHHTGTMYRTLSTPNNMNPYLGISAVPGYTITPISNGITPMSSTYSLRPPLPVPSTNTNQFLMQQQQQRSTLSSVSGTLLPYSHSLPSIPSSALSLTNNGSSNGVPKMLNSQAHYAAQLRLQYSQNLQQQQQQLQLTKRTGPDQRRKPQRPTGLPPSSALLTTTGQTVPLPSSFRSPSSRRPLPRNAPPTSINFASTSSADSSIPSASTALTLHRTNSNYKATSPIPRCSFNINGQCRHAIATRQCTNCLPFDPLGTGYLCDRCWEQRHPWYRAPHEFIFLPLREEAKKKLPPIQNQVAYTVTKETLELLNRTRISTESLGVPLKGSSTEKTIQSGTAKCDELIEKMAVLILQLRDDGWMARERAARTIQKLFRRRKGVKLARRLICLLWGKVLDPATNQYYYISRTNANRVTWNAPTLFGIPVDVPDYPRVLASQLTEEQAARMVQASWRRKKVKRNLESIALSMYRRVMDKESGRVYYYNMLSRAAQWNKPKALGTDLEPPFYNVYEDHVAITRAAILVQRNARRTKAKKLFIQKVKENYEQVWDAASQRYFYYSRKTGESTWTKPFTKYIGNYELPEAVDEDEGNTGSTTEKTATAREPSPRKTKPVTQRKVRDKPMTQLEATMYLATLLNVWRARKAIAGELLRVWQRVFDPEYGAYYYYNTVSGESTWYKPAIVKRLNVELPIVDMDDDEDDNNGNETDTSKNEIIMNDRTEGDHTVVQDSKGEGSASASSFTTTHPENQDIFFTAQENTLGDTARTVTQGGISRTKLPLNKDVKNNSMNTNLFATTVLTEEDAVAAGITENTARRSSTVTIDRSKGPKSTHHGTTKTLTPADALRMHWNRLLAYLHHVQPQNRHQEILTKEETAEKFYKYGTRIWIVLEKQYPNTTGPYSIGLPFINPPYLFPGKGVDVLAGIFGGKIEGKEEDEINGGEDDPEHHNRNHGSSGSPDGRRTRTLTNGETNKNDDENFIFALTARSNVSRTSWDDNTTTITPLTFEGGKKNGKGKTRVNNRNPSEEEDDASSTQQNPQNNGNKGNDKKGGKKWWQFGSK